MDRHELIDALRADPTGFRERVVDRLDGEHAAARLDRAAAPASFDDPAELGSLTPLERDLVWRLWVLGAAPFGLTLAGPAYQDTPIVYANRTFRRLTGYPLSAVRGENLRLLQGPETDPDAVATLREAVTIWESVTVELLNYRRDGTPFRNRVSVVPMAGPDGAIANWVGIQRRVESP
ncbi:MAG: PAS sensor histidine kinase [uncultured archaeon A07HR67]|nr:MAG: PAS sensor histidine kinase [uncultured archaeon A07HR67]